jgi:hypothetical protein
LKTPEDLRNCAKDEKAHTLRASIDGNQLKNLENYRVESPLFNFTFPENNLFGAPVGPTQGVSPTNKMGCDH